MNAELYEDSLQQQGKHETKNEWWAAHGVKVVRVRFDGKHAPVPVSFGDYYRVGSNIVVDTKRNVDEIAKNINGKEHERFRDECKRAQADGYKLVVLVENSEGITDLTALEKWINPHCGKFCGYFRKRLCIPFDLRERCKRHHTLKPIQGDRLAKAMSTMSDRYGVQFEFCTPENAAQRVCMLLGIEYDHLCSDCYRFEGGTCKAAHGFGLIEGAPKPVDGNSPMCSEGCPF